MGTFTLMLLAIIFSLSIGGGVTYYIIGGTSDIEVVWGQRKVGNSTPTQIRLLLEGSPTLLTVHIKTDTEGSVLVSHDLLDNARNARLLSSEGFSNNGSVHITCFLSVRGGEPATCCFVDIPSMTATTDIVKSKWLFSFMGFYKVIVKYL